MLANFSYELALIAPDVFISILTSSSDFYSVLLEFLFFNFERF